MAGTYKWNGRLNKAERTAGDINLEGRDVTLSKELRLKIVAYTGQTTLSDRSFVSSVINDVDEVRSLEWAAGRMAAAKQRANTLRILARGATGASERRGGVLAGAMKAGGNDFGDGAPCSV